MIYRSAWLIVSLAVLLSLGLFYSVGAQNERQPVILTSAQTEAITERCNLSKIALGNVHSTDAVRRINLGQEYANLTTRLMAPLNSRISLAGGGASDLVRLTDDYNTARQTFVEAYRQYDETITEALSIDCRRDPVDYYATLVQARLERAEVRRSVQQLNSLATQYYGEFREFADSQEQSE